MSLTEKQKVAILDSLPELRVQRVMLLAKYVQALYAQDLIDQDESRLALLPFFNEDLDLIIRLGI